MAPRRRSCAVAAALWSGFLACCLEDAAGFDIEGHDAQGQTAGSAMDQQAIKQLKRLMGGKDAADVAGWGHQADATYPGLDKLHFQIHDDVAQPFCGDVKSRVAKCDDNICLMAGIKHFYGKILADENRKIDYPKIDYSKIARGTTGGAAISFTDADAIKMLINLLGDMHQPLHVGYAGDNTGRDVQVKFQGETVSLYTMWDKTISEYIRKHESQFWLGGWTHVSSIRAEHEKDKAAWKADGWEKTLDRWMEESVKFACETAYVVGGKKLAGPGKEAGPVEITEEQFGEWKQKWLRLILLAGQRTAIVLNDILDAKGAAKLADGTGVKTKADEEEAKQKKEWEKEAAARAKKEKASGRGTPSYQGSAGAGFTNLCIAVVVVPIFMTLINFDAVAKWVNENIMSSGAGNTFGGGPKGGFNTKRFE